MEAKKIKFPEYENGVDYFKLFCDSEDDIRGYDYKIATVYQVWVPMLEGPYAKKIDDTFFYKMYCANLFFKSKQGNHSLKNDLVLFKNLNKPVQDDGIIWAFVTLGFDDHKITPASMLRVSKLVFEKPWVADGSAMVLERHRRDKETGELRIHHHTHILIHFNEKKNPSRVIDETFKTLGMKYIMRDKNGVDYLGPQKPKKAYQTYQTYYNYVRGIKCSEKMPYVEMDGHWRNEHGIPHLFEK